ncbi:MAG TPA: hypothetical protein VGP68_12220, partial [Gemmataceae bacterium]|nr:hypothetical protein [Gemmataceae bacterium]
VQPSPAAQSSAKSTSPRVMTRTIISSFIHSLLPAARFSLAPVDGIVTYLRALEYLLVGGNPYDSIVVSDA